MRIIGDIDEYFDLDYNWLTVEVDLDFDNTPVYSYIQTQTNANSFDFIRYSLFNDNNRKSMYDIFEKI